MADIILILIVLLYSILIIIYSVIFNLYKQKDTKQNNNNTNQQLNIICAVKNESKNIYNLLSYLNHQSIKNFELILVDDHSTDNTLNIIQQFKASFKIKVLKSDGNGKKAALRLAVNNSQSNFLLFTDCDCCVDKQWVEKMSTIATENNADMVLAPILIIAKNSNSLFQRLWQTESLALITLTAGSAIAKHPIMCNGGNLLVKRNLRIEADDFINNRFASGDDMFLLQYATKHKKRIIYSKQIQTVVSTSTPDSLKSLLKQRGRWVSKTTGYTDIITIMVATLVFTTNISIIITFILAIINICNINTLIIITTCKLIADTLSVISSANYYKVKTKWYDILLLELLYPLYTICCTIYGLFGKIKWR